MSHELNPYAEHPQDILRQWLDWRRTAPVALVIVTRTTGGSVRAPGAIMAVRTDGSRCGYISGGCIDKDVALRAVESLTSGASIKLRYGAGSPFLDMPLPCGGAIDVEIVPDAPLEVVRRCHDDLVARVPTVLCLREIETTLRYFPKLRVRIAGRGADALALAKLVAASGFELILQLRGNEDVDEARRSGLTGVVELNSSSALPPIEDDAWTAFVLMFHDPDWEPALLSQALAGDAFYIGAVGSRRAQDRRRSSLVKAGHDANSVNRIKGPIGLVAAMRSASMLAVSVMAEVIDEFHRTRIRPFAQTALILLAAGASKRFDAGDKLLADLRGKPVLAHAAHVLQDQIVGTRIAVVGTDQEARANVAAMAGWNVIRNPDARNGQATSLLAGLRAAAEQPEIDYVLILLADMPLVSEQHLMALQKTMHDAAPAAMSLVDGALCPPAIVSRKAFYDLMRIEGDQGAKHVIARLPGMRSISMPTNEAIDIDTIEDLLRASELLTA